MIHIPVAEITQFLIKLSGNRSFLRIGRILMLSLVLLSAIGLAGIWVTGLEPWMPGCTVPAWGCYTGHPLTLAEYVNQMGATKLLLILPLLDLFSFLLIIVQPPRAYLMLMLASLTAYFLPMFGGDPSPYTNTGSGNGYWLHLWSCLFLILFSFSLAIAEQSGTFNKQTSWQEEWGLKK